MLIVDLGFSSAKWLHKDKKGIVKSCFRKTKDNGYPFRGESYDIGDRALLQTGSHYLRTVDELVEMYPLFVAVAGDRAGIQSDNALAVGLPYDFWKQEMKKKKTNSPNIIDSLASSLGLISVGREYAFDNVLVLPQGLGGIKAYLAGNKAEGNILAIDVGFNTVISTLYSCGEGEILTGKTYYKKGLHDMAVNLLLPEIQKHIHGKTLTPLEINHIVQTGSIQVGFDLIDVRSEIENAVNTYVHDLLSLVIGDLKAHGGVITFQTVLFFGGGARWLKDRVESQRVKIVALDEPEFSNAIGFRVRAEELLNTDAV